MVLTGYLVVAEILARPARDMRLLAIAFCAATLLALAFFLFEAFTNGYLRLVIPPADSSPDRFDDITALGRGLTALAPSLFPGAAIAAVAAIAAGWRRAAVIALLAVLFLVAFAAALELTIAANSAAILGGVLVAAAAFWRPRMVLTALTFIFVITLAVAPVVAAIPADVIGDRLVGVAPLSWLQRLYIWRNAGLEALSCLPFGCGADYARSISSARETFTIVASPELRLMPIHPHNVFLQIWLELGLPGVIFVAVAILAAGRWLTSAALTKPAAAALAGAIAATLLYWSVEASIWQAWRLGSLVLAAAGVAIVLRLTEGRDA
jgi:O-antigen ligase